MRKIQRCGNGEVVFTVSGRLEASNIGELSDLLTAEPPDRPLVLDLKDVVLVDRDVVRYLRTCEVDGIELRNCPPYIRAWIAQDAKQV
jgi:anti-anti-sigma regulatory factor